MVGAYLAWRYCPAWPKSIRIGLVVWGVLWPLYYQIRVFAPPAPVTTQAVPPRATAVAVPTSAPLRLVAAPGPTSPAVVAAPAPTSAPALVAAVEPTLAPALVAAVEPTPAPAPVAAAAPTATPARLVVIGAGAEGVSLRTTPGTGDRLKLLEDGAELISLGDEQQAAGRAWKQVKDAGGTEGWVASEFLGSGSAAVSPGMALAPSNPAPLAVPTTRPATTAPVAKPSGPAPPLDRNCPAGFPIKATRSSTGELIYHVQTGESYAVTKPEQCFATAADAAAGGYRASLR
jgi:hypothetical protein